MHRVALVLLLPLLAIAMVGADTPGPPDQGPVVETLASSAARETECERGTFKSYWMEGERDPPSDWRSPRFELSQNYPNRPPSKDDYPWLSIPFENGGPVDPPGYLNALLEYGLEGNIDADFVGQDNRIRTFYNMPWMDLNTELPTDRLGTDGREFVHGLTHELDSQSKTLGLRQSTISDTWAGSFFNDRAGYGIGQVWCDPNDPDLDALQPDPTRPNSFLDGAFVIKLLFSTVSDEDAPFMRSSLEWDADIFVEPNTSVREKDDNYDRNIGKVRLLQIDVAVRDDRALNGWLFGTFAYDGSQPGETPWDRLVALGLQWGNDPDVTPSDQAAGVELEQQWINRATSLVDDHLGYGGRLAGPVDDKNSSCMSCHSTAGSPPAPVVPEAAPTADGRVGDAIPTQVRMAWMKNVEAGVVFDPDQTQSADYSLQLSMSMMNFMANECTDEDHQAEVCSQFRETIRAENAALEALLPSSGRPSSTIWYWLLGAVGAAALLAGVFLVGTFFSRHRRPRSQDATD